MNIIKKQNLIKKGYKILDFINQLKGLKVYTVVNVDKNYMYFKLGNGYVSEILLEGLSDLNDNIDYLSYAKEIVRNY